MINIIENTPESIKEFHERGWGGSEDALSMEHINALLEGKAIAFDGGEYTHVFYLKDTSDNIIKTQQQEIERLKEEIQDLYYEMKEESIRNE